MKPFKDLTDAECVALTGTEVAQYIDAAVMAVRVRLSNAYRALERNRQFEAGGVTEHEPISAPAQSVEPRTVMAKFAPYDEE